MTTSVNAVGNKIQTDIDFFTFKSGFVVLFYLFSKFNKIISNSEKKVLTIGSQRLKAEAHYFFGFLYGNANVINR